MKLTPLTPLPLLLRLSPSESPARPATCEAELLPAPEVRSAEGAMEPPVDEPAGPAIVLPVPGPAAGPPVEPDDCGAAAVCEVGVELSLFALDDVLTEVEPAVVGVEVLFVSDVTTAGPPG